MFEWKLKAQNIFLDENTGGKGRYFKARILQPGLVKYSFGVCLLEKETIDKFINEFVGCPVIIGHNDVTKENADELVGGHICHVWFDNFDSWYWVDGIIDDQDALNKIDDGWNVSCQYEITEYSNNTDGKLHNGNPYDKVILNGKPEHLAIVATPRYENAMIAVNALEVAMNEDKDIEWITVKGNHIPVKKGQSKEDAVKEFIESKQGGSDKNNSRANRQAAEYEKLKDKIDTIKTAKEKITKEYKNITSEEANKLFEQANKIYENFIIPSNLSDKDYDEITDIFQELEDFVVEKNTNKEWGSKQPKKEEKTKVYTEDNYDEFHKKFYKEHDDKWTLQRTTKGYDVHRTNEQKKWEFNQDLKQEDLSKFFTNEVIKLRLPNIQKKNKEGKSEFFEDEKRLQFFKDNGYEPSDKYDDGYYTNFILKKKEQNIAKNSIIEAINEIKDTDMFNKLFRKKEFEMNKDEMKQIFAECLQEVLIAKNEEEDELKKAADNEEDEEDKKDKDEKAENKCKNEDVDKRDIIRQIMAIAGKEEASEDVKTIAKLAEKLAYDKSEAGTADNGKKAKCEDEEDEEDKKEEAKNKAKNSIDALKGVLASAGVAKAPSKYVTQSDAIELGNQLF